MIKKIENDKIRIIKVGIQLRGEFRKESRNNNK
jgi:hypothetical protein